MEAAHKERGFSEIAQNITIFPDGKVMICRSLNTIPAGIKNGKYLRSVYRKHRQLRQRQGHHDTRATQQHSAGYKKPIKKICHCTFRPNGIVPSLVRFEYRETNLNRVGRGITPPPSHTTVHALAHGGFFRLVNRS